VVFNWLLGVQRRFAVQAGASGNLGRECDELIGNIVKIIADDVRLRTDAQNFIANALDERGFPAGRYCAKCIPGVAGYETKLRWADAKLPLDIGVSLARRLVVLHTIRAEPSFEKGRQFRRTRAGGSEPQANCP